MAQRLLLLFLIAAIFPAGGVLAEVKTFSKEMRRVIGDNQSLDDVRTAAVAEAKRQALEEAGTYLETLTVVRNSQVASDNILALAAGVTRSRIVKEEPFLEGDTSGIRIAVAVSVDTAILDERIKKHLADRQHLAGLKASQKRVSELLEQNKALQQKMNHLAAVGTRQEIQDLQAEIRENTRNLSAQEWFGKGETLWNGREYDSPQQAVQYFSQAIELDPSIAVSYYNRGNAYAQMKQHRRAIEDYNRAIQLDPGYAPSNYNRGNAYADLKQYPQAIESYDRAIQLDRGYTLAYNNRGNVYSILKQYRRAVEDFDRAIVLDPNLSSAYANRGLANSSLKQYRRAIEDLDRAIRLDPEYAPAYKLRGFAYLNIMQFRRAIEDFDRGIELDPGRAPSYKARGIAYIKIGRYQRAIEDLDRAIKLDPVYAPAYNVRGLAYFNLKQFRRAIEDYDRGIKLDPGQANAYNGRGVAHSGLGQRDLACQDWRQACDLGHTGICEWLRDNKKC